MRAFLIANTGDADAGYVGARFADFDFEFKHLPREYSGQWPTLDGVDLVLLLGSEWSVYWGDNSKSVEAERELIRETHRRGIPLFGICYGAQIIASALGGSAERAKKCEIGWHEVVTTPTNAVLAGLWLQWHCDTFTPPAGSEVLAFSDAGPQALRVGRSFATQFHPEANEAIITRWLSGSGAAELAAHGIKPSALMEQTRNEVVRSGPAAAQIVDWFLHNVANTPMPKLEGSSRPKSK